MKIQTALDFLFPPSCLGCGEVMLDGDALCGACWRDTTFISGLVCNACGVPLIGQADVPDILCDDCMATARPWTAGRSALVYRGVGRALVLKLKHGDRQDVVKPAAQWMAQAIAPCLTGEDVLVIPVPLHWRRMLVRRFNQSALLAHGVAAALGAEIDPGALVRRKHTPSLDRRSKEDRFGIMQGVIEAHGSVAGRTVLIVDDVMTSGATLAAATEACLRSKARTVYIVTLARVAKDA